MHIEFRRCKLPNSFLNFGGQTTESWQIFPPPPSPYPCLHTFQKSRNVCEGRVSGGTVCHRATAHRGEGASKRNVFEESKNFACLFLTSWTIPSGSRTKGKTSLPSLDRQQYSKIPEIHEYCVNKNKLSNFGVINNNNNNKLLSIDENLHRVAIRKMNKLLKEKG